MRRSNLGLMIGILVALATGCSPTPAKVCKHLLNLDAESTDRCDEEMQALANDFPQYWPDVGACFLASKASDELVTCYEVMDTIRLQDFCSGVMTRIPDAYGSSIAQCLREHRALWRQSKDAWEQRATCVHAADAADAVRACARVEPSAAE